MKKYMVVVGLVMTMAGSALAKPARGVRGSDSPETCPAPTPCPAIQLQEVQVYQLGRHRKQGTKMVGTFFVKQPSGEFQLCRNRKKGVVCTGTFIKAVE